MMDMLHKNKIIGHIFPNSLCCPLMSLLTPQLEFRQIKRSGAVSVKLKLYLNNAH